MSTTLLDPPPSRPALDPVAELHRLIDRLHASPATGAHADRVTEIDRAIHRLSALKLKVLAAADRAGTATDGGFADTGAWIARQTRTTRAAAAREVALATELESGHDATAAALDAGLLSPAHAAVIVHASEQLPHGVSPAQRTEVESALVARAQRFDPDQLRRDARRAIETIEPDQSIVDAHENDLLRDEEEAARDRTRLTLHDNGDGTTTGHFTVPTLAAAFLRKILESMTAPRRMRDDHLTHTGLDWDHRRGLALTELLEHLPTDHLHTKTAATVVVTLDHPTLTGALRAAHLDTGHDLSAGEARRLACTAGILPAVLDGRSAVLDLGHESRLFNQTQRLALGLTHRTCAADGCERPYAWCELHHRRPWASTGRTDLANAVPLCHWHHARIHDHSYSHTVLPDGSLRFTRTGAGSRTVRARA